VSATLYTARWVLPVSGPQIRDGAVAVEGERILGVGRRADVLAALRDAPEVLDLGDATILPGFVNAHAHLEYTVFRGLLEGLAFLPWIERLTELKYSGALDEDDFLASARQGALESLRAGVTTVADHADVGSPVRALSEAGLRGIVYQEVFGATEEVVAEAMSGLRGRVEALRAAAGPLVRIGVTPHTPFTSCETLLGEVAGLARAEGMPLSIHLAETREEVAFVERGEGRIAERWREMGRPVRPRGVGPVPYLASTGFLDSPRPVQCVHLTHASRADLDLLASLGATAALCPLSNERLCGDLPPTGEVLAAGLGVGLGTDSAASADRLDLFPTMRAALRDPRAPAGSLSAEAVLRAATLGGAISLGLEGETGSLEPGKAADLIALEPASSSRGPDDDPAAAIVESSEPEDIRLVVANGRTLYDRGRFLTLDPAEVAGAAQAAAGRLARAAGKG
jgi:5-methylthioadenosine/S-adenosylhomocysteine deaminase